MQVSTIAITSKVALAGQMRARAAVRRPLGARATTATTATAAAKPVMAGQAQASPFAAVDSEEALFAILKAGAGSGQIPSRLIGAVSELYSNYKAAIMGSGLEGADEVFVAQVMASVCERVLLQLNPAAAYTFPSFHERILEPYNYYNFGQRYIRGLIDFSTSMLGNEAGFEEIEQQLKNGENVVLLANHQTEVRRRLRSALRLCSADRTVC
jgi:glycerol-3-phosphate O-acyltransferase